jgi:hypothetical protein
MSETQFEHLFSPLQVGPMQVPNRICETTNTINSSMIPGEVDENFREHHTSGSTMEPRPGAVPAGLAARPGCSTLRFRRKRRMK